MNVLIDPSVRSLVRKFLLDNLGLHYPENWDQDVLRNLTSAAGDFGFTRLEAFIHWLLQTKLTDEQLSRLATHFTVGETYFYREPKSLEYFGKEYLPGLISERSQGSRKIRIWVAGCASGEEAYTVAIILKENIANLKNWNISIIASDINPVFLNKAKKGVYKKWSFRNNPDSFVKKYFSLTESAQYQIDPEIMKMVTFRIYNLMNPEYPFFSGEEEALDVIFCRNVLIYFSAEGIREVSHKLYKSLNPGGLLLVSPAEMSQLIWGQFGKKNYMGYTIYQKTTFPKELIEVQTVSPVKEPAFLPDFLSTSSYFKSEPDIETHPVRQDEEKEEIPQIEEPEKFLSDSENVTRLARQKADSGDAEAALELCRRAIQLNKTEYRLHYLMATILLEQGDEDEAIAAINRSIYLNPDFELAYFMLGNIYMKLGKIAQGMKHYMQTLSILKKYPRDAIIPDSDGLTVGRLSEIIHEIQK